MTKPLDDVLYGINEGPLDELIISLTNDADSISTILNSIQMEFYDTNDYFKGDVADSFRDKWAYYNDLIPRVKENLATYSEDMVSVKKLLGDIDVQNSTLLNNYTDDRIEETNKKQQETEEIIANIKIDTGNVNKSLSFYQ